MLIVDPALWGSSREFDMKEMPVYRRRIGLSTNEDDVSSQLRTQLEIRFGQTGFLTHLTKRSEFQGLPGVHGPSGDLDPRIGMLRVPEDQEPISLGDVYNHFIPVDGVHLPPGLRSPDRAKTRPNYAVSRVVEQCPGGANY